MTLGKDIKIEQGMLKDFKKQFDSPRLEDIKTPRMVGLISANGGGTKLLQSYIDNHPEVYNIPAYPMLYFYAHWKDWEKELADRWSWESIIEKFCEKHASVIDSRRILGTNGLDKLGENKNEHVEIDERQFRHYLKSLLDGQSIARKKFLLAAHYAFALCNGEDITKKKVLFWHHHDYEQLGDYTSDFPDTILLGMIRDPRPKLNRLYDLLLKINEGKLSAADVMIYREYVFNNTNGHIFDRVSATPSFLSMDRVYFIRHEDLKLKLEKVMRAVAKLLDITFYPSMLQTTFNGKLWWGHAIYNMDQVTGTFVGVISKDWQKNLPPREIFVMEGIFLDFFQKYEYALINYKNDTLFNRILLCFAILCPFHMEWDNIKFYLNPKNHWLLIKTAYLESTNKLPRPDYTWNATHLYKWDFLKFKLYRPRTYQQFLDFSEKLKENRRWKLVAPSILFLSQVCYVAAHYVRFLLSVLRLPIIGYRRVALHYRVLFLRLNHKRIFAQLLS